jgi:hypothetical protein
MKNRPEKSIDGLLKTKQTYELTSGVGRYPSYR